MLNWNAIAKEIADTIWKENHQLDLTNVVENTLQNKGFNINDTEILEHFDKLKRLVSKFIQSKIDDCTDKAITPRYRFSEADPDILVPTMDKSSDKVRLEIISTIQLLSWRAFERFCVYILKINGLKDCECMRGTKEEGIDFFGMLDLGKLTGSTIWHNVHIRVLGQAKKGLVTEQLIRLFNQDMESFLRGEGRAFQLAPEWFRKSRMPLIGLVLTSNKFTSGAIKWSSAHNIVSRDSQQMIEDLFKSTK